MQRVIYDKWGGPEQLRLTDSPSIPPHAGQVRIALEYAGVNPADWKFLSGSYKIICKGGFPRGIAFEGAGTVVEAGPGAGLAVGTRVAIGHNPQDGRLGTAAQEITIDAVLAVPIPDAVATRDAAVLPVAASTAWTMCEQCGVGPGSRVLVVGASGGVGVFAVQIAKARGAHVTALAGEKNRALIESLGADCFLDYRQTPAANLRETWDAVLDCVSALRPHAKRLLNPGGHYIDTDPLPHYMLGDAIGNLFSDRRMHTVVNKTGDPKTSATKVGRLLDMMKDGKLRSIITEEYPLAEAAEAYRRSLAGHAVGKIVLKTGG